MLAHAITDLEISQLLTQHDNGFFTSAYIFGQYMITLLIIRQENDRLRLEVDRMRTLDRERSAMGGVGMGGGDMYGSLGRSRSPDPRADPTYGTRVAVEVADLQDKLAKSEAELRRSQAEIRLNQGDYERSNVELEQMQEKVKEFI